MDIVYLLGEVERDPLLASRIYAHRFLVRTHPNVMAFSNPPKKFEQTGSVKYKSKEHVKAVTDVVEKVELEINDETFISLI